MQTYLGSFRKLNFYSLCIEKRRGGKNWVAHITGLDTTYGYKREFLQTTKVGREKVFQLEDFHVGEIYEVASMYTAGASKCVHVRGTYECEEITEDQVILRCITQDEVIGRFGESNGASGRKPGKAAAEDCHKR